MGTTDDTLRHLTTASQALSAAFRAAWSAGDREEALRISTSHASVAALIERHIAPDAPRATSATESATGTCETCGDRIARDGTCEHLRTLFSRVPRSPRVARAVAEEISERGAA